MSHTFDSLQEYFEDNKHRPLCDWLTFDTTFKKPGKQGLVGLMTPSGDVNGVDNPKIVFKISQYINYLVQHEFTVMKSLDCIAQFCPYFCRAYGTVLTEVDANSRTKGNPFDSTSKYPVEKEVMMCEYINKSNMFSKYIGSDSISDSVVYSTIKQVLMGIAIAQKLKKFTHYDLHSSNVMMKRCNKDVVFVYVMDDDNQYCVPTHGHYPVIIDYGFSYSSDLENGPAWPSMAHTNVGFTSDRFDPITDPKLFLVTVSCELKKKRKNRNSRIFRNVVKNAYAKLNIDWESGWDDGKEIGTSDVVTNALSKFKVDSVLFNKFDHYCIDLLQSLIILPMEEQSYEDIEKSYTTFVKEFGKIEIEIGNPFYNIYILKGIVDISREVVADYSIGDSTSRRNAITYFSRGVAERIACVASFCSPKDVHWEKMLCSLICLSRNIEGFMYDISKKRDSKKQRSYKSLPVSTPEGMYSLLEANIQDNYTFSENTNVYVMDVRNRTCIPVTLTKTELKKANRVHPLALGTYIYGITT
jgi:hypothetical protein